MISHANANARVAIAGRATGDTLELATAVANANESTTSAHTLNGTIIEIIALITEDAAGSENLPRRTGKDHVPVVSVNSGRPLLVQAARRRPVTVLHLNQRKATRSMPQHGIFRGALVLAMMSVCAGCAGSSSPRPTSSRHDSPRCAAPTDVLAGVYHPSRLQVLAACRTVSGTVTAVSHEQDGDLHIGLDTRGAMTNAVNSSKLRGNLLVEFMPRDGGHLRAPRVGDRVRLTGAWVLDTNHGWEELHPVWSERLDGITDRSGPQFGGSSAGVGSSEASAECATNTGAGCRGYGR